MGIPQSLRSAPQTRTARWAAALRKAEPCPTPIPPPPKRRPHGAPPTSAPARCARPPADWNSLSNTTATTIPAPWCWCVATVTTCSAMATCVPRAAPSAGCTTTPTACGRPSSGVAPPTTRSSNRSRGTRRSPRWSACSPRCSKPTVATPWRCTWAIPTSTIPERRCTPDRWCVPWAPTTCFQPAPWTRCRAMCRRG